MVLVRCRCGGTGVDIPLLPFPARQILPSVHIPISSVIVQNPPDLLPPRSIWPLSICPGCRWRSQPLFGGSRKQRYNTLDFPAENRVPRNRRFLWILPVKGELIPSEHPRQRRTLFPFGISLPTGLPNVMMPFGFTGQAMRPFSRLLTAQIS